VQFDPGKIPGDMDPLPPSEMGNGVVNPVSEVMLLLAPLCATPARKLNGI
jgi:hypothetical protein